MTGFRAIAGRRNLTPGLPVRPALRMIAFTVPLAATAACGGDGPTTPRSRIASISVTLASAEFFSGVSTQATAVARSGDGTVLVDEIFTWTSTDTTVAVVDGDGLVTGVRAGTAEITASSDGVSGTAEVVIVSPPPVALSIAAQPIASFDGSSRPFHVAVVGHTGGISSSPATVTAALVEGSGPVTGTLSRQTDNGVAVFDDLTLSGAGPHTLRFTAEPLAAATSVPVEVLPDEAPAGTWFVMRPRVVRRDGTGQVGLTLVLDHPASRVELVAPGNGPPVRLDALTSSVYTLRLDRDLVINPASYTEGDRHTFVGFLDVYQGDTRELRYNVFANVRTADVPDVATTGLSAAAQQSDHVLNLRWDELRNGNGPTEAITREVYRWLPDEFDFLIFVEQVETFRNRHYIPVRNATPGVGSPFFDAGQAWHSPVRLEGMIDFPISGLFDAAATTMSHEIGHRWMVWLQSFASGAHWKPSDMANGVMGHSIEGGAGGSFPYDLVDQGAAGVRVDCVPRARTYNAVELYLMGLLPHDSVQGPLFVLEDLQSGLQCGSIVSAGVRRVTIDSLVAEAGQERPLEIGRQFRAATVVLSVGSLLAADEMAFFDAMAARGAAETDLPFTEGFVRGSTLPFFLATDGRARLDMRIR